MGYLTTFTIYNDGLENIKDLPEQFAKAVYHGACSMESQEYTIGNCGNMLKVHRTRHADDHTCYVHTGNTVCEMNPFSAETKELNERYPEFFDDMLKHLEENVKKLKKMKKETEAENRQIEEESRRFHRALEKR
jgi:hypothetical protein